MLTRRHEAGPTLEWLRQAESPGGAKVPDSIINRWQVYARAADDARLRHGVLEMASLVVTAAIPACAAFGVAGRWIAVLGAVAVVLNGGRQLFGWKESWANRKKVRYSIEREIALFRVGAGRYASDDALVRLVETVEETCAEERDTGTRADLRTMAPQVGSKFPRLSGND